MATPAPPLSTPAASRTRDWVRTAEPGSAFSGLGRGGRGGGGGGSGGGRGRSRGGRGRGGGGGGGGSASTSRAPTADKPVANEASTSKPAATSSGSAEKSSAAPVTPGRSKAHGRKSSRSVVPTVVVGPASPSIEAPTTAPRPSNRRRRSQQLNSKGNATPAASLKVNVPPLNDNLLRPQNRLVPHSAPPPSKDTPPHLAGTFDMRNNIDALVERVRAVAMDNRPSTPGSHIDWAGDDDEGLPDLDDWGVKTGTSVGDKDEMISPIIVDGLKPLPEPVAKPPTPSGDVKEDVIAPFVMKDQRKAPETVQTPLHPSLPPKPVPGPASVSNQPQSGSGKNSASKSTAKPIAAVTPGSTISPASEPPVASVGGTVRAPDVKPGEKQDKDKDDASWDSDSGREGLAASIHAPTLSNSLSAPSNLSTPPTQPRNFNPTHNRAQTVGRAFPQTAPVNFNSRFPRSGTSTPRGGYSSGGQHARTHSSPPAGSVLSNHRPPHARPVITGDAISRLARTIASESPSRTPAISASNI
ncbi:proline/serine-rich protein [Mycena latifolia]|nr:proline/serine-rich protein [Mycena latifolia]